MPRLSQVSRKRARVAVGLLLGGDAGLLGRLGDLQAVLVGAGEEVGVVAEQAVPAGQRVGDHRGVGVPDVGRVVHVVDRRRDVEPVGHRLSLRAGRTVARPGCGPTSRRRWSDTIRAMPTSVTPTITAAPEEQALPGLGEHPVAAPGRCISPKVSSMKAATAGCRGGPGRGRAPRSSPAGSPRRSGRCRGRDDDAGRHGHHGQHERHQQGPSHGGRR